MSDWQSVCDAIMADIAANVPRLATATAHLYAPWNPEELIGAGLHVAVWPLGEAEASVPLSIGGSGGTDMLHQSYTILIWEDSTDEQSRLVLDTSATTAFLDLHNAVRTRLYQLANQTLASSFRVHYDGTAFAPVTTNNRWMRMQVSVQRVQAWV